VGRATDDYSAATPQATPHPRRFISRNPPLDMPRRT